MFIILNRDQIHQKILKTKDHNQRKNIEKIESEWNKKSRKTTKREDANSNILIKNQNRVKLLAQNTFKIKLFDSKICLKSSRSNNYINLIFI